MAKNPNKVGVWQSLRNAWKVEDIRKKLIYTFFMLVLFRLVGVIPAPGVDYARVQAAMGSNSLPLLDLVNMMTGSNFQNMTIMAMGITPYINSSIIMQLLTIAIPALERMQKSGPEGQKKIAQITRYVTVLLAVIQAIGLVAGLGYIKSGWFNTVLVGVSMAGGTALAMWIGERITEKGLGNGISLLIFAGIISNLFTGFVNLFRNAFTATSLTPWLTLLAVMLVALFMIVVVTYVDMGVRRINVHFAKRVSGRKMYGGQNSVIPMKVVSVGVLPLIFAYSFMAFPGTIIQLVGGSNSSAAIWWSRYMNAASPLYLIVTALLIIAFTYFYTSISFQPDEMAKNIQQQGGAIPSVRPGKPTADYLRRINNRLTLFAALFLAVLATVPTLFTVGLQTQIPFAASSILIAVSVVLETKRQLDDLLVSRNYDSIS
ncbi:MAG: preprotein translocase subunit SecY [Clostridiales bacterium]|nr:preprotein translocase subunit SecY [Clostridiales bacterium]MDO4349245.1 preprotein translocase subunit SecY [Eubacteriales bacterium]MDY4008626.1 preprotein translocase subunit SecY [Candidatus Limiplasma sp.]